MFAVLKFSGDVLLSPSDLVTDGEKEITVQDWLNLDQKEREKYQIKIAPRFHWKGEIADLESTELVGFQLNWGEK